VTCDLDAKPGGLDTFENCKGVMGDLGNILGTGPTAIIHTGNGIQPLWALEGDTEALELAGQQALIRRWGRLVTHVAGIRGGKVDSTFNLDRLHRAPGTTNTKPGREPVEAAAALSGGSPVNLDRLTEVLDEYNIPEDTNTDTDTGANSDHGGQAKTGWEHGQRTCPYVVAMYAAWATDEPATSRHAWLGQQAIRLTAAHRAGCITGDDHKAAQNILATRFLELLARPEARKPQPANEIAAWFRDAIGIVEKKTDRQVREELGDHDCEQTGDAIFEATEELAYIKALARRQMVSPSAVLVSALTFVLAATPHDVCVPAFIGKRASLNFFAGIIGDSGVGKTAGVGVAKGMFGDRDLVPILNPSSGEGIPAMYRERKPAAELKDAPEGTDPQRWIRHNVLSVVDEISTLAAQGERSGSTLGSTLRSAWSGSGLSNHAADPTRQRNLPEGQYSYGMVAGIQYSTAHVLLRDEGAGTPQRFLWASASDPGADMDAPDPGPSPFLKWTPPPPNIGNLDIGYPQHVRGMVRDARLQRLRNQPDAPDGHMILVRLKVAAGLAILHGGTTVTEDLWTVSGLIVADSDQLLAEMKRHGRKEADKIAAEKGRRTAISEDGAVDYAVERVKIGVVKKVHATAGGITHSSLRKAFPSRDRKHLDAAIEAAAAGRYIVKEMRDRKDRPNAEPTRWYTAGKATP
jgi:hypothetical protein